MKNNWDQTKKVFIKTLERLIEKEAIIVNELYSIDGLAAMFSNDLAMLESDNLKQEKIDQAFETLRAYYPDLYQGLMEKLKNEN